MTILLNYSVSKTASSRLLRVANSFSSAAVRKVSAPSHHSPSPNPGSPQLAGPGRKQVASLPVTSSSASQPGGGGVGSSGAGGAGSRQSLSALLRANKSELQEQKQLLVSTVVVSSFHSGRCLLRLLS